jgi:hypothetical protein
MRLQVALDKQTLLGGSEVLELLGRVVVRLESVEWVEGD